MYCNFNFYSGTSQLIRTLSGPAVLSFVAREVVLFHAELIFYRVHNTYEYTFRLSFVGIKVCLCYIFFVRGFQT